MPTGHFYCGSCVLQRWSRCDCGTIYCCGGRCCGCGAGLGRCAGCCAPSQVCEPCQDPSDDEPWYPIASEDLKGNPDEIHADKHAATLRGEPWHNPRLVALAAGAVDVATGAAGVAAGATDIAVSAAGIAASAAASSAAGLAALWSALQPKKEDEVPAALVAFWRVASGHRF